MLPIARQRRLTVLGCAIFFDAKIGHCVQVVIA